MSGWPWPERRRATSEAIDNVVTARAGHLPIGCDHSRHLPITSDHFSVWFVRICPHVTDMKMARTGLDVGLGGQPRQEEMPVGPTIKMMSFSNPPDGLYRGRRPQVKAALAAVIEPPYDSGKRGAQWW
jgi:hypothetical protein